MDAIRGLLGAKGVMSVDELRRGIEAIPEAEYHRLTYYQRWIRSIADNLMARGVITAAELAAALAMSAFAPGAAVRVRDDWPEARGPVHIRTPHYLRGRPGTVVRHLGDFPNPEDLAFARPARACRCITSRSTPVGIWPERRRPSCWWRCSNHGCSRSDPAARRQRPPAGGRARLAGGQGHRHRGRDRRAHPHTDEASPGQGARMVARAWLDPAYRALLLRDGTAGGGGARHPDARRAAAGRAGERAGLHHLVVCTLCSCYPRAVLGYPPFWFKSAGYRARAVRDPAGVLAEWRTVLPPGTRDPRGGQHGGLPLDGAAAAPAGHGGLDGGAPGRRWCAKAT